MKKTILLVLVSLFFGISLLNAQTTPSNSTSSSSTEPKRKSFRATKDQVTQVQKMLKENGKFAGEADGKYSDDFRTAVKTYQGENGLRKSGSLNRTTLEKMGIALTDSQKEIPANPNDLASGDGTPKKRGPVFRASKDQVMQAQKKLKDGGMLSGEEEGKLDDATRAALKKYQTANGLKETGTLNQVTLEKMNIELTDKQKGIETPKPAKSETSMEEKPKRGPVFRASKDQITEVQTKLKTGGMYSGEADGKLTDETREAIKKWQAANGVKVTGTLNKETLEKMGVELTDKQKAM